MSSGENTAAERPSRLAVHPTQLGFSPRSGCLSLYLLSLASFAFVFGWESYSATKALEFSIEYERELLSGRRLLQATAFPIHSSSETTRCLLSTRGPHPDRWRFEVASDKPLRRSRPLGPQLSSTHQDHLASPVNIPVDSVPLER